MKTKIDSTPEKATPANTEEIERNEICNRCNQERHLLLTDIEQSTLSENNNSHRLKFLEAFAENQSLRPALQIATALHDHEIARREDNPDFDITGLSKGQIVRIAHRSLQEQYEHQSTTDTANKEARYKHHIDSLRLSGKSTVQIIQILALDPNTPESEKVKLQQFAQIIAMATKSSDQHLIQSKINTLDLAQLQSPISFIKHHVFDLPQQKSGFSQAFQHHVAETFNLPKIHHGTVADMENSLEAKAPIIDQRTGKISGFKPAITRDNAPEVRPGIIMYVDEYGHKTYEDLFTGETFHFHGGVAGRAADKMRLQFLSCRPKLLNSGVEDIFGLSLKNARMPKEHELHRIHEIQNAILGGSRNLNAEVMTAAEIQTFCKRILFINQFGETTPFNHSSEDMANSRNQLGVMHSNDPLDINLEVLSMVGNWLNANPYVTGKAAYDELLLYLKQKN